LMNLLKLDWLESEQRMKLLREMISLTVNSRERALETKQKIGNLRKQTMPDYKQLQFITDSDTRTFEERLAALPFVRDEDLPEWEEWANRTLLDE